MDCLLVRLLNIFLQMIHSISTSFDDLTYNTFNSRFNFDSMSHFDVPFITDVTVLHVLWNWVPTSPIPNTTHNFLLHNQLASKTGDDYKCDCLSLYDVSYCVSKIYVGVIDFIHPTHIMSNTHLDMPGPKTTQWAKSVKVM